jgi:hypothetical protein
VATLQTSDLRVIAKENFVLLKSKAQILFLITSLLFAFQVQARSSKYDVPFNLGWKFYKGSPTGTPQSLNYNDAGWESVNVPHSASYDPPTVAGEIGFYGNVLASNVDYWYRKKFICPPNARKVFIQFGAVMQSAIVFVNGTQVGSHYNSGYTGFIFDISNNVARGDTTCIALHAHISNDGDIPPGDFGPGADGKGPDFLLFSGMNRTVQLFFKDSVYVPVRGQRTATAGTVASPTVHAFTTVRNESKAVKSVTVTITVRNKDGASVASQTSTLSVPANSSSNFDMATSAVANPLLWSPSSPNLYSLKTVVSVAGIEVDSVVESIGLRFYTWSAATPGGLSINGVRTEIKGVCLHQAMGWVEAAVPDSRWAKNVGIIKAMGVNGIRCSHYPRSDAFYHACDSIGMLVLCEVPSWAIGWVVYNRPLFWSRMYGVDSAMVLDGYNHPSIWGWCLFNEPSDAQLDSMMAKQNAIIHNLESVAPPGRVTLVANPFGGTKYPLDIHGVNYSLSSSLSIPLVNTEEYSNWTRNLVRGNAMDLDVSGTSEAAKELNDMKNAWSTTDKCGGAHFWCFMDYCSIGNQVGRAGIVDRFYIPKNAYFMFQNSLLGTTPDFWTNGTATKIDIAADQTTLRADGTDLCQITATLRNANNQCVQQNCVLTFTASPATSITALYSEESANPKSGNSVTVTVEGGRAGVLVRASRTPGNIAVNVTNSCGLPPATVNLTSTAVSETIPALNWDATSLLQGTHLQSGDALRLKIAYTGKGIAISFPSHVEKTVQIINCQGKTVCSYSLKDGKPALVGGGIIGCGVFYAAWDDRGGRMHTRLNIVR